MKGGFRRSHQIARDSKVVSQGIRRSDRKYAKDSRGICQYLGDVVDRAVAATGENRVAAGVDRSVGFFDGMFWRLCGNQFSFDSAAGSTASADSKSFCRCLLPPEAGL